jgi:hypothetical protein
MACRAVLRRAESGPPRSGQRDPRLDEGKGKKVMDAAREEVLKLTAPPRR